MNSNYKVLLVEDNLVAQISAKAVLKTKELEVDAVSSGKEALEVSRKNKYDFILMDVGLEQGTDGIMVTEQIQKNGGVNKNTPVIILSANSSDTYQDRLKEVSILEYLLKPFSEEKLEDIIKLIEGIENK